MTLVLPADAKRRVPVMIMFGGGTLAQALGRPRRRRRAVAAVSRFRRRRRAATRRQRSS